MVLAMLLGLLQGAEAQDYRIGAQDVLKITVYEHPDLTVETRVSENGTITFPLLGDVSAKNLTTRQLETSIAEKLVAGGFINNPQVNIFIVQYRGQRVTVVGEVNKPGQYELVGQTTLLDIISNALGLTPTGGYTVTVFRKEITADGAESTRKITLDLDRLLNEGDLSQNIPLQHRDVVHVPKALFYIYGEVNRPGAYRLEKGITVRRAIALAGGLTPKGSTWRIAVARKSGGHDAEQSVDLDDPLRVDDVVRIRESIF